MKPLFKCKIDYIKSPHLSQIYVGFELLKKYGFLEYSLNNSRFDKQATKPVLRVTLNQKYTVIFDTLDGLNWIEGTIDENLNHFRNNLNADFYFKRSYCKLVKDFAPNNCKVYPLGLNYHIGDRIQAKDIKETIKDIIGNNSLLRTLFKVNKNNFNVESYEYFPIPQDDAKILFLTRLWNPDDVDLQHLKDERARINKNRINCILACRKEFKENFMGGIQKDNYSSKFDKELLAPFALTNKGSFLNGIKDHNICIATIGLHNSIGWKFGEYVAASRAIITEPIVYELPGCFDENRNYLTFRNEKQLIYQIRYLMSDKHKLFEIMNNNFLYYNNYLRPDRLVMNALLSVYREI